MIRGAAARFARLFVLATVGSGAIALPLGGLFGVSAARSVSLAWYGLGVFLVVGGFLVGNRGPARPVDSSSWMPFSFGGRAARWATHAEQEESINLSAVFVVLGFVLIALGIVVDPRYRLL